MICEQLLNRTETNYTDRAGVDIGTNWPELVTADLVVHWLSGVHGGQRTGERATTQRNTTLRNGYTTG